MTRRHLECDYWGTLTLVEADARGVHSRSLGLVEDARHRVPASLLAEYERLLDEHRSGFDPEAEAAAAWRIAKGVR